MKERIRIIGTKSRNIQAKVEPSNRPAYQVTIGSEKWRNLPSELRRKIWSRAKNYVEELQRQVEANDENWPKEQ